LKKSGTAGPRIHGFGCRKNTVVPARKVRLNGNNSLHTEKKNTETRKGKRT